MHNRFYLDDVSNDKYLVAFSEVLKSLGCKEIKVWGKNGQENLNPLLNVRFEFICDHPSKLNNLFIQLEKQIFPFNFFRGEGKNCVLFVTPLSTTKVSLLDSHFDLSEEKSPTIEYLLLDENIEHADQIEIIRNLIASSTDKIEQDFLKCFIAQIALNPQISFAAALENVNRLWPFHFFVGMTNAVFRDDVIALFNKLVPNGLTSEVSGITDFFKRIPKKDSVDSKVTINSSSNAPRTSEIGMFGSTVEDSKRVPLLLDEVVVETPRVKQ